MSDDAIEQRVGRGWLQPIFEGRGVFLVGGAVFDQAALHASGELALGARATVIRHSAAETHLLLPERYGQVTVGRPTNALSEPLRTLVPMERGGRGLVWVREVALRAHERIHVAGTATTSLERTLLDIAAWMPDHLKQAWREADYRDLIDEEALGRSLGRGRKGTELLREFIEKYVAVDRGAHGVDSPAELDAIRAVIAAGAPPPLVNLWLTLKGRPVRLDLYWSHARLCVEIDGFKGHRTRMAFERDAERANDLLEIDVLTMRFTERQITDDPEGCAARILEMLEKRGAISWERAPELPTMAGPQHG